MNKIITRSVIPLLLFLTFSCPALTAEPQKHVVFITRWDKVIPQDVLELLSSDKAIRLVAVFSQDIAQLPGYDALVAEGRIEPAMSIAGDPVLPYIFETRAPSSETVLFSYPDDVSDIIARNQETFKARNPLKEHGVYSGAGMFSEKLIPIFKAMGVCWANFSSGDLEAGIYDKDGFFVVIPSTLTFTDPVKCADWAVSDKEDCLALVFNSGVTSGFLRAFKDQADDINMTTFSDIRSSSNPPVYTTETIFEDSKLQDVKTFVWLALDTARKEIENYKNSGVAEIATLSQLKEKLYRVYGYGVISKLTDTMAERDMAGFKESLAGIYGMLGRDMPEMNEDMSLPAGAVENSGFQVIAASNSITIDNSLSSSDIRIESFSVRVLDSGTLFSVRLSSSCPADSKIDIYMDLNNKPMAGATSLLEGIDAYMEPDDAWEFAVSMGKDTASLFRPGTLKPKLTASLNQVKPYSASAGREALKGNPLNWGYQAVLTYTDAFGKTAVGDFLVSGDKQRQALLKRAPLHLKAVRKNEKY